MGYRSFFMEKNMIGSTNSKINSGGALSGSGGSSVLAHNNLNRPLTQDEKVLLRYGLASINKKQDFTINATNNTTSGQTYVQPVWFNNNLFCIFAGFNSDTGYVGSFAYAYNGSTWNKTALTGKHNVSDSNDGISFRWLDGMGMLVNTFNSYGNFSTIDSSGQTQQIFSDSSWCRFGKINDTFWGSKYGYGSGHTSGIYARGVRLTTGGYTKGHYLDAINRLILYTEGNTAYISQIGSDDASITATYSSGDIGTRSFIGCTGLGEDDYVFFADDYTKEACNNFSGYSISTNVPYGTVASSYSVFKINSSHQLVRIDSSDTLYPYINIDKSLWRFDDRNNCLVIGTTNNVYVLEFNQSAHTWTKIASDMPLPNNNSGQYIYNASLSPDKRRLAVYAGDTNKYAQNLFIYDIRSGYTWTIVENSAQNYDSVLAFTGVWANGGAYIPETGESYEIVKVTLPPDKNVICALESDYEPELSIKWEI